MRSEIIAQLSTNQDYFYYIRENPVWYKVLTIHPEKLKDFLNEYKVGRKRRLIDKIDDINTAINLAEAFLKKN